MVNGFDFGLELHPFVKKDNTKLFLTYPFHIKEEKEIKSLSSSTEEFNNCFNAFEMTQKIRHLDAEILNLGYEKILSDEPIVTATSYKSLSSMDIYKKQTNHLFLSKERGEHEIHAPFQPPGKGLCPGG